MLVFEKKFHILHTKVNSSKQCHRKRSMQKFPYIYKNVMAINFTNYVIVSSVNNLIYYLPRVPYIYMEAG